MEVERTLYLRDAETWKNPDWKDTPPVAESADKFNLNWLVEKIEAALKPLDIDLWTEGGSLQYSRIQNRIRQLVDAEKTVAQLIETGNENSREHLRLHNQVYELQKRLESVAESAGQLQQRAEAAEASLKEREASYMELIMAVGMKHPGETRHQTALKYILRAEEPSTLAGNCALASKPEGK